MKKFFTKFDEISKNHPDKIAIETPDYSLTYLQLAKDINLIATGMRNEGVVCGDTIGFYGDRDTSIVKSFISRYIANTPNIVNINNFNINKIMYQ